MPALLDFQTPRHARLNLSSLSSTQFASSYSLGTLGLVDGSISYLFSTTPLFIPAASSSIPLRSLILGYRQLGIPQLPDDRADPSIALGKQREDGPIQSKSTGNTKPTLLHATLQLPPPSTLNALYSRRTSQSSLVSVSVYSNTATSAFSSSPPPAALLAHVAHDTGKWSLEGLASTDSALLGARGLWNFGFDKLYRSSLENKTRISPESSDEGLSDLPPTQLSTARVPPSPPSLLSAGAEFYYSPLSSVVGLSTGLRFTTLSRDRALSPENRPHRKPLAGTAALLSSQASGALSQTSSFPYTLTLTLTPLTGSLASTYSVLATQNLSLSSRFGFNVYSWESECVLGAEIWRSRQRRKQSAGSTEQGDNLAWARQKAAAWLDEAAQALSGSASSRSLDANRGNSVQGSDAEDNSVIKLRVDDNWNIRALWVGRYKELLVSAGVNLGLTGKGQDQLQLSSTTTSDGNGGGPPSWGRWKGTVGLEVAWSS